MSTVKITALSATTDPASSDILPIVSDPSGSAVTKKVTIENLMKNAAAGSASLPGVAFDGDPDSGVARVGANNVAICTNGTNRLDVGSAGVVDIKLGGSASTPALIFEGDVNTGISHSADTLVFSTAGSSRLDIGSGGVIDIKSGGSSSAPALIFGGDTNTGISHSADTLTFSTAGSSQLTINSSGNAKFGGNGEFAGLVQVTRALETQTAFASLLGNGTDSTFKVTANGHVQARRARSNTIGNVALSIQPSDSTAHYGFRIDQANNDLKIDKVFGTNATLLTLTSTGNAEFGGAASFAGTIDHIAFNTGSNDAAAKGISAYDSGQLIIQGSSGVTSGTQTSLAVYYENTEKFAVKNDGSATFASDIVFIKRVNNTDELFFGYGTTSGIYAGIGGKNNFNSDQTCNLLFYINNSASSRSPEVRMVLDSNGLISNYATGNSTNFKLRNAGSSSSSIFFTECYQGGTGATSGGTVKFAVATNGGISNVQSNNVDLCDEREKKNIVGLETKWDKVKSWELKKFHYNEDADTDDLRYGVIAQQIETVCPEVLADWRKQGAEDAVLDDDGDVVTPAVPEIIRKGVKEQQMMWMAIKALQEAQARIETLEAKVAALES